MNKQTKPARRQQKPANAVPEETPSPQADDSHDAGRPFPIVGIGASAGGLEALKLFLENVPAGSGMAFVIVQHLDPTHKGIMPELLQRATAMPVIQVKDRTKVQPNCVYVIPPNKDMSILHGVLHLLDPAALRTDGNEPVWVHIEATASEDGQGCRAAVVDITERKRTEEALRESLERFQLANRATFNAIWDWNLQTDAVWWNEHFQTLFGYRAEEIEPGIESWTNRIHPEDLDRVKTGIHAAIDSGQDHWFDHYRFRRRDGMYAEVEDRGYIARDASDHPVRMIGAMQDITERKRAEEELRKSEERFKLIFEYAPDAYYLNDLKGNFIDGNKAAEKTTGYKREELIGSSFLKLNLLPLNQLPKAVKHLANNAMGRPTGPDEFILRRKAGDKVSVEISTHPVKFGNRTVVLGIARDITERKRAEGEIRRLNEELERRVKERTVQLETLNEELEAFSHSVSHDLRAPLRSINGFSQALLENYKNRLDEQGQQYLERLSAASQRMAELIDDLLLLSHVARAELKKSKVDLTDLARSIMQELQKTQPERQVEFVLAPGLAASGDPNLMRTLLENFLSNAWKFTSKKPQARIEFGMTYHDDKPVFFIQDNGAGFDMTYADKLFKPFQRLHSLAEFPGTGIGLASVRRIVHRHGGRAWAKGKPNEGATFYFTI